jgi:hypothetical protein
METIRIEFPLKNKQKLTEDRAVEVMMTGLRKLVEFGALKGNVDDFLQNYEFEDKLGYALAVIKKEALVDASKLNSIGASFQYTQEVEPEEVLIQDKQFSMQSIEIRMREMKWAPKLRFANTIRDFRKYWKAKQSQMAKDPVLAKRVQNLFLLEISGIFAEILPYIEEGRQLAVLTGINVVTQGMTSAARDLSLAYRKALKASKTGQLSKTVYTGLRTQYNRFISELIPQVFPGIEEILGSKSSEEGSKRFSEVGTGIITLTADIIAPWEGLLTKIKGKLENGESVNIKIGGEEFIFGENNKLDSFEAKQFTKSEEKNFSDGRVRIFTSDRDAISEPKKKTFAPLR